MSIDHELASAEHIDTGEAAKALDPRTGKGAPTEGTYGGSSMVAPHEPVDVGLLAAQPAAVLGSIVAVADAILVAAVPLPEWATSLLVAVVTIAGALGIRSKVTPVARPRLDADTPLSP